MEASVFDLDYQNEHVTAKIVAGFERIAEALRVLIWQESKAFSLSPIQIQILIFLQFHSVEKRKVGYLSKEFNLTKPTISDAVKVMEQKGLIYKEIESSDNRSYTMHLTEVGQQVVHKAALFANTLEQPIAQLSADKKEDLLKSLMHIIYTLQRAGVISLQRMCYTCQFYSPNQGAEKPYCLYLKMPLEDLNLRLDCPEHEVKQTLDDVK